MGRIALLIIGVSLLTACETPTDVQLSNSADPESSTFVPVPPTQVQASANEAGTLISITWQDNSDYESGYSLERRIGSGNWQEVATLEPNTTSYSESFSSRGTKPITYRIAALGDSSRQSRQSTYVESNRITFNYLVNVTVVGEGSVSERVISAKSEYAYGSTVELSAIPATGWAFARWDQGLDSDQPIGTLTVTEDVAVTVVFEPARFYRDANGVSIKCENFQVGVSAIIDGVEYTKRTREQITPANASTTCTSGITNMSGLFSGEYGFNEDISHWDVSSVTDMNRMFQTSDFNRDIGNWDVSSVTNMECMFNSADSFDKDIGEWDVSSVTDMSCMFSSASSFNKDIGKWDVSNVESMSTMFWDSPFNQDIGNWDVSSVRYMFGMFAYSPFNQDIGNWDVSSVESMGSMFSAAISFNQDIGNWDVSNVTHMNDMFAYSSFNQDIGNWDVSSVTDMGYMFYSADVFNQDLTEWCVNQIVTEPEYFAQFSSLSESNKPIWGTCPGN